VAQTETVGGVDGGAVDRLADGDDRHRSRVAAGARRRIRHLTPHHLDTLR
jgi:hypothetical protein